jgi:hypothetical protein
MKSILRLGTFGLLAFAIVATPELSRAADSDTNAVPTVRHRKKMADTNAPVIAPVKKTAAADGAAAAKAGHNKSGVLPFHGKLKEANVAGKTISVGVRTFVINSDTIITKDGKTATLADGVVGDEVGGAYKKTEDGKLVITKLRFGAKVATEPGATK